MNILTPYQFAVAAGSSPPLDLLSVSTYSAAFSLRLLRAAYTGNAIKVRNNTTNALQDIGFNGSGNLDTASLATFLGSADGYVETLYDQSGHGLNVTASGTTRPRIALAGAIDLLNGVPTMVFNGANFLTNAAGAITSTAGWTANAVAKPTVNTGFQAVFDQDTLPSTRIAQYIRTASGGYQTIAFNTAVSNVSTSVPSNSTVISSICTPSVLSMYGDGTVGASTSAFTGTIATGAIAFAIGKSLVTSSPNWFTGKISEVIGFSTALSTADRHLLERNQGVYYGVTVA